MGLRKLHKMEQNKITFKIDYRKYSQGGRQKKGNAIHFFSVSEDENNAYGI